MTLNDLLEIRNALNALVAGPVAGRIAVRRARNQVAIDDLLASYDKARDECIKAVAENGESINPQNAEEWGKFLEAMKDVNADFDGEEFEFTPASIKESLIEEADVNANAVTALCKHGIIVED